MVTTLIEQKRGQEEEKQHHRQAESANDPIARGNALVAQQPFQEALPLAVENAALRATGKILVSENLSTGRRFYRLGLAGLLSIVSVVLLIFLLSFPRPAQFLRSSPPTSRSGSMTEFATLTHGSGPGGITAGSDDNLWFTERNANKIGRITPEGMVTEFVIPTPHSGAGGIATGPDGNLWFTEDSVSRIGRMTLTGRITEFATPTAQSHPVEIIAGPDGSLWFTEYQADKIGRITPCKF